MPRPLPETTQLIEEKILPTISESNWWYIPTVNYIKYTKQSYQSPEVSIGVDSKSVTTFFGVQFVTDKKQKAWQFGWLLGFSSAIVLFVSLGIALLASGATALGVVVSLAPLAAGIFVVFFIVGYTMGRFASSMEMSADISIRSSDDFLNMYVRNKNWLYGGGVRAYYFSQAYFDLTAGRLSVSVSGIEGILLLSWPKIKSVSCDSVRVYIAKNIIFPAVANIFGARDVFLQFKNPEEAKQFIEIAKQYLP